jgi:hypothetical protein
LLKQLSGNMPKKMSRNKCGSPRIRTRTPSRAARLHSVKDLLTKKSALLTQVSQHAIRQNHWENWLASRLPAPLAARVSSVSEHAHALVIFAESAAWAARLRYAIADLEQQIRAHDAALTAIEVRVLPRS